MLLNNSVYKTSADEGARAASVQSAGFAATDTSLIVADFTYNYGPGPEPFTLTVQTGTASALSTTGGTVTQTLIDDDFTTIANLNAFYYDVSGADEIDGLALTWNVPVDGLLVDEELRIVSRFTYAGGFNGDTWDEYVGLLRHRAAGRYYFLVYDPAGTAGTSMIAATSTIERKIPVAVVKGTPLTAQTVDTTFTSNAFTYAAGVTTDGWQQFNATGTGTGVITLDFLDPATAYGRLNDVPTATSLSSDFTPIFTDVHTATSTTPTGRILLDDGTSDYLVVATTATSAGTLALDFARRAHTDLGSIAAGAMATRADESLTTTPVYRYLVKTGVGNRVTVTVHPDNALLDTRFDLLDPEEASRQTVNTGGVGADDTLLLQQTGNGWTAFTVSSAIALPVGTNTFDLTVAVQGPPFAITSTATVYDDACVGGTTVALDDPDEGLSIAPVAAPAGFTFFGAAVTDIDVSSNGLLSFGTLADPYFGNTSLPDTDDPNAIVAPYWTDLDVVTVCRKTVGTKLIIQWTGELWSLFGGGDPVAFQAILDGADDTIEFVYSAAHASTGDVATVGVENATGTLAAVVGFNSAGSITPGAGKKLTPM
jgi:hypothetical protein